MFVFYYYQLSIQINTNITWIVDSFFFFFFFNSFLCFNNKIDETTIYCRRTSQISSHKSPFKACFGYWQCLFAVAVFLAWENVRWLCCCCHCNLAAIAAVVAIRLWCTFACLVKWSDRENRLSHIPHPYGLTPECERQCRDNSSDREKRQVQPGHMQPYGFSPECLRICTCWVAKEKKTLD